MILSRACSLAHCQLTCDLRPALEEGGEFVGGAEVAVARLALVDRAVGDVVGVFDQAQLAGPTVLVRKGNTFIIYQLQRSAKKHEINFP